MVMTVFQVLDRAVGVGGINLLGKDMVGSSKGGADLLNELCESGLLVKTGASRPKYTVTELGRQQWESQVSPERRAEVHEREAQHQRKELIDFLTTVAKKRDKALAKTELARFSPAVRQAACDRGLAEPGARPNSYRLLGPGAEMLEAEQPIAEQVRRLRDLSRQAADRWQTAQGSLMQALEGTRSQALREEAERLAQRGATACRSFDAALAELSGLAGVAEAARKARAEIETAVRDSRQAAEVEHARLTDLEARLRGEAEQLRKQLEEFERRLDERLDNFARKVESEAPNGPPPTTTGRDDPPSEAGLWEATRAAYEMLHKENLRTGGIVKIPELTDAVLRGANGLSASAFHTLLRDWQQSDRLTLQLCNDPRLEPRAAEGIRSSRGLLFYVQMR